MEMATGDMGGGQPGRLDTAHWELGAIPPLLKDARTTPRRLRRFLDSGHLDYQPQQQQQRLEEGGSICTTHPTNDAHLSPSDVHSHATIWIPTFYPEDE